MNQTNNYSMNLYEGNDLFNPLVVNNPNFEIIDSAMKANADASIGVATELLNGTVHALTRSNTDAPVFRFTATADWTSGDTVTVDGVQVSALLPNGTALYNKAYVINATVLCVLVGSLLTVFVPADTSLATDSARLGGELPSYYGTAVDVQNAKDIANAATVLANNANAKIEDMKTYSREEKIVGYWVDGSPVYEITVSRPLAHVVADANFNIYRATLVTDVRDIVSLSGQIEYDGTKAVIPFTSIARNNIVDADTYFNIDGSNQLLATAFFRTAVSLSTKIDATIRYIKN